MPKIVFSGTAISVTSTVSHSACTASGDVTASQAVSEAVLERAVEDHPERDEQQQGQVAERAEAEDVPRQHRASSQ